MLEQDPHRFVCQTDRNSCPYSLHWQWREDRWIWELVSRHDPPGSVLVSLFHDGFQVSTDQGSPIAHPLAMVIQELHQQDPAEEGLASIQTWLGVGQVGTRHDSVSIRSQQVGSNGLLLDLDWATRAPELPEVVPCTYDLCLAGSDLIDANDQQASWFIAAHEGPAYRLCLEILAKVHDDRTRLDLMPLGHHASRVQLSCRSNRSGSASSSRLRYRWTLQAH